jgi:hypothetical protein
MKHKKRTAKGRSERLEILSAVFGQHVEAARGDRRRLGCEADDVLDALAAL